MKNDEIEIGKSQMQSLRLTSSYEQSRNASNDEFSQHYRPKNGAISARVDKTLAIKGETAQSDSTKTLNELAESDDFILAVFGAGLVIGCIAMFVYHEVAMAIFCVCR